MGERTFARLETIQRTARAFRLLGEAASADSCARLREEMGPSGARAALLEAIETLSDWHGPPGERALPLLDRMRLLIDGAELDDRVAPIAAAVLKAFGSPPPGKASR